MMSIKTFKSFKYQFVFAIFLNLTLAVSYNGYAQTKDQDSLKIIKLDTVIIRDKIPPFIKPLPAIKGTYIFSGRKSEIIELEKMDINRVDNNARQLFSKSPGIFVYETDGSGNQVNISTRGLNAHRSWEFNVRHNSIITNSDLYGYPASHFNPPTESIERIELVRGGASLQYGAQFGGMINYVTKSADTTKRISFETQQSVGSYGLFNSYNAIGGKLGKFKYYTYVSYRRSDGYRENSDYKYQAYHANLEYDFSPQLNIKLAYNKMYYVNHLNGGLTDQQFKENPRQSTRKRNYYSPDIYVPSLTINYKLSNRTQFNFISSAVLGERNSVQFIALSTVNDTINTAINAFNPRQVDRDYYNSYSNELRIVHNYQIAKMSNTLVTGIRYINNNLIRKQLGKGTSNSDYDLSLTSIDYGRDLKYKTGNVSLFVENLFKITEKLTFTAGVRVEDGETNTSGTIKNYDATKLPVQIKHQFALFGFSGEYAINENVKFLANWSQAYRPVIFADLIPTTTLNRVDPNIRDAFGHNSEISLRGNLKGVFQFDLTAFNVFYKHRIGDVFMTNNGQSFFYKTNTGTSRSYGLEFYGEISPFKSLGSYTKNWNVSIHTATSYLHAQYINSVKPKNGENINVSGNQVEAAPNWMSRNGLQLRNKGFSTTIQYSFVGKSFADAFNTVTPNASGTIGIIPSYQLVDWNFTYRFQSGFNIKLLQNNILNKQYFTQRPSFFPGPGGLYPSDGRSFIISIGAKF